jgi:hypothetical protein
VNEVFTKLQFGGFFMKKFFSLIVVLALLVCVAPVIGSEPTYYSHGSATPGIARRASSNYPAFDRLIKQTVVTLNTDASINSYDVTSTGTVDVTMVPGNINYPIKVKIQNHGTASLTYVPYETGDTGVTQPTATAAHLLTPNGDPVVSGKAYEAIFYHPPNFSVGASGEREVVIDIWGRR